MLFEDYCERVATACILDAPGDNWVLAYAESRTTPTESISQLWDTGTYPSARAALRRLRQSGVMRDWELGYIRIMHLTWRMRESMLFSDGFYQAPVWRDESFWTNRSRELIDHFAHVSTEAPGMIAYTESPEKGELDRQTRTKAGRYLNKFFGDVLTPKQIAFYAEWQTRGSKPLLDMGKVALKFATTPDEIVDAYKRGPSSCMAGSESVRVYGAGDLAIAYLEPEEREGNRPEIIARALVWPAKKAVSRIYPNVENWRGDGFASEHEAQSASDMLLARLKAEGYRSAYEDGFSIFDGARILAEKEYGNRYVMPYIDHLQFSGPFPAPDGGEVFHLSQYGDYAPETTGGEIVLNRIRCERCESLIDEDDENIVIDRDGDHVTWCYRCFNRAGWCCDYDGETYADDVDQICVNGSQSWTLDQFEAHGFTCEHDGEAYSNDHESSRFPGFHRDYDDDASVHPELAEPEAEPEAEPAMIAAE